MALGVEYSSTAPQLIQSSGQALVQGIRQIGQQISGHLTEIQTKRDMAAMAQELQGLNVQSNEFTPQLAQVISRHPLAARDERGKMALSILGQAHGQWQAGEAEARAFNRAMALQTRRRLDARDQFDYETEVKSRTPQPIGGALVIPKDPVTGQPNVLIPAPARAGANRPMVLNPGDVAFDPTGKKIAENPKPRTPSTAAIGQQRQILETQATAIDRDIKSDEVHYRELLKAEEELKKELDETSNEEDRAAIEHRRAVKALDAGKIYRRINESRAKKLKLMEDIGALAARLDETAAANPLGLPSATPSVTPPASNTRRVPVLDPNGQPMLLRADQVESALQYGWKLR